MSQNEEVPNNSLQVHVPEEIEISAFKPVPKSVMDKWKLEAADLIIGGMISGFKTPEAVVSAILTGYELGLPKMASLANIHNIGGRSVLGVNAIQAILKSKDVEFVTVKDYEKVLNKEGKVANYVTSITFYRYSKLLKRVIEETSTYTFKEAQDAGLTEKDVWKKYPRQMLYARAFSLGARRIANDLLLGIYSIEEMSNERNAINFNYTDDGQTIIIDPEQTQ